MGYSEQSHQVFYRTERGDFKVGKRFVMNLF